MKGFLNTNDISRAIALLDDVKLTLSQNIADNCNPEDILIDTKEDLIVLANKTLSRVDTRLGLDPDLDDDGVVEASDMCPDTVFGDVVDPTTGCSIERTCSCEGPFASEEPWKNHGEYVSCVAKNFEYLAKLGLIVNVKH